MWDTTWERERGNRGRKKDEPPLEKVKTARLPFEPTTEITS